MSVPDRSADASESSFAAHRASARLRRSWWLIALASIVGAICLPALAGRSAGVNRTVDLQVANEFALVDLVSTTAGSGLQPVDLRTLAQTVSAGETEARLSEQLGYSVVLTASADADARTLQLRTSDDDPDRAEEILTAAVVEVERVHRTMIEGSLGPAVRVLEQQVGDIDRHIDERRADGAEAGPMLGELERSRQELANRAAALAALLDPEASTVAVLSSGTSGYSSAATTAALAVAGAVGAAVLATLLLLLLAAVDRRVRTTSDVEHITGPGTVLAELPSSPDDTADAIAAASIEHVARADGFERVRLVLARDVPRDVGDRLAGALITSAAGGPSARSAVHIEAVGPIETSAGEVLAHRDDETNVVAVARGATTGQEIERTLSMLVRSGHHVAGLVLVGTR